MFFIPICEWHFVVGIKHIPMVFFGEFDIVCTAHRKQLYKKTNKMHFLYVFILQFLYDSTCFERPFRSSSGVHDLLYSAAVYKPCFAWFI